MSEVNQSQQFINGQVIERPKMYNEHEGILKGLSWDKGNKSALFFFYTTRTTGTGENKKKTYTEFSVRFWGRNAQFLESIYLHSKSERESGNNFLSLINMQVRVASWERDTGKTWGDENKPVKETVTYFEGKAPMLMKAHPYEIVAQGQFHQTPEELAAQQQQQA
jgi:hypothetical protein